ncbi:PREDICTED: uncharacterized protein LOC105457927 [Wasmannia auropunctata]|uniref:uncharacterized protein LOC105457927 n=1 Tax=Wasmannia auropunctata TaxID=64793 RepID=UPI0005EE12DC|nr:PREDICTED: uncharacterized protein LOC105457927 [Wasmannia auropunctata]
MTDGGATSLASISPFAPQLLTSALVYVRDPKHNRRNNLKCRALLDTGATANFISESFVERLNIPVVKQSLSIGAINDTRTESKGIVQITIQSLHSEFQKILTCLTIPTITDLIPSDIFPRNTLEFPSDIKLADPEFHRPRPVDLLIGSGATLSLFTVGQIDLSREGCDLYLQKTHLGWVVAGGISMQIPSRNSVCHLTSLENQLAKFWRIEEVVKNEIKSEEEIECESYFTKTVSRNKDGRYIVRLPFRHTEKRLGDSRSIAFKRLTALERKFNANAILKDEYTRIVKEYLELGHMSLVEDPGDNGYYMPHHAVVKESSETTKVRIVFDASAKTNTGVSLNDMLMTGPSIQNKLFSHLIRFRIYNFVVTADIEKMFRQVFVHESDRRYQRVLWRKDNKIQTLQLNTLTFGVSSSPFLAIRVIQRLAEDERHTYPRAADIIKSHLYVDDLLTGANTIDEVA